MEKNIHLPIALFNSRALFNPYQYVPFFKIMGQEEDGWKWENARNLLITDEVGVGKTFEAGIILREMLHRNPNLSVLIFCPVKLCANWTEELRENFGIAPVNYHEKKMFGQTTIVPYSYFGSKKSSNIKEEKKLENTLAASFDLDIEKAKIDRLPSYDVLILDEAHYIRNKGKLNSYITQLIGEKESDGQPKLKIFMTGTPVFNQDDDYCHIVEPLGKNFETTSTLQGEANCYDSILNIKLGGMKADGTPGISIQCSDIEAQIINDIFEKKEDRNKYGQYTGFLKRISSSSFYSLKKYVENKNEWENIEYDDTPLDDESIDFQHLSELLEPWDFAKDSKLKALKKLLQHLIKQNQEAGSGPFKAVIFSCYIHTCNYLKENLETDYNMYSIVGSTGAKKIEETKNAFKHEENPSILICSDAAKEGHNLQFCHYLIHYDFPYTPAAMGQRNGRIYRRGQKYTPQVFYMPLDRGYDNRLFGEIIVEKCGIVKRASEEKGISILNILPSDSGDYVKSCIREFVNDFFESGRKGDDRSDSSIGRSFLKKYFTERSDRSKWKYDAAKILYDDLKDNQDRNGIKEKILALYENINNENDANGSKSEGLLEAYQKKYDEKLWEFINRCFGIRQSEEKPAEVFKQKCREVVHAMGADHMGRKYCHDMIDSDDSIEEYKKEFQPLKEWEVVGNGE